MLTSSSLGPWPDTVG